MRLIGLLLCLWIAQAGAEWQFSDALDVTPLAQKGTFHHLDAAGRRSIALSGDWLGVVWEDNSSGQARIYAAFAAIENPEFSEPLLVSPAGPAYEPVIAALDDGQFALGWEANQGVWVARTDRKSVSGYLRLSNAKARQVSLSTHGANGLAAWSQTTGERGDWAIVAAKLDFSESGLSRQRLGVVDTKRPKTIQSYPATLISDTEMLVAWQDRRRWTSAIFYTLSTDGEAFGDVRQINETVQKSAQYGRGSGASRVSLTWLNDRDIAAVWLDKRGFLSGYDVYAALGGDTREAFGFNSQVQDWFGNEIPQWHAVVTGHADGTLVAAWDDPREESQDVYLSWKEGEVWSEDLLVEPASGDGEQGHPSMIMDAQRRIHLVWIDQQPGRGSQVKYSRGDPLE